MKLNQDCAERNESYCADFEQAKFFTEKQYPNSCRKYNRYFAQSRSFTHFPNSGGQHESTEGKKGNQVYVEGKLKTRSWEDKEGNTRYTTEVVGDNMTMLGRRGEGGGQEAAQAPSSPKAAQTEEETDDLPF